MCRGGGGAAHSIFLSFCQVRNETKTIMVKLKLQKCDKRRIMLLPHSCLSDKSHISCVVGHRRVVGCRWQSSQAHKKMPWSLLFLVLLLTFSLPTSEGVGTSYLTTEEGDRAVTRTMPLGSREVKAEPPLGVKGSTIMFLHVFKVSKVPRRTIFRCSLDNSLRSLGRRALSRHCGIAAAGQ